MEGKRGCGIGKRGCGIGKEAAEKNGKIIGIRRSVSEYIGSRIGVGSKDDM